MATDFWIELPATTGGGGSGVSSLNGLTGTLVLVTGTSGTDFNIVSGGSVISLNIPTASATNRGLLSSADWTTFNNKQNALTFPLSPTLGGTGVNNAFNLTIGGTSSINGTFSGSSSGTNTGDQTITLTGDVTGSGTGTFATTISVGAVTDTKGSLADKPSAGVVATTNQTLSGFPVIDGVTPIDGTLVLLSAQTTGSQNGPWVAHAGAWTRPTWYPSGGTTQAFQFITEFVRLGTTYGGTTWKMTTAGAITIDTTATTWTINAYSLNASTVTGVLPVSVGGTGATTAPAARVNLNIDERTTFSNANYTVLSTDRYVAQIGTMSAPRTVTLPLASSVNPGQQLIIIDESGTVTTTNTIIIARAGSDTINNTTSGTIRTAFGRAILYSDGVSKWTDAVAGISRGGTGSTALPTNGQLLIGDSTTNAFDLNTLTAGPGITITNGPGTIQVSNSSIGVGSLPVGFVGDGVDGDVTISVNTTLTRDMDYNSLTVNAGITLNTGGFVIFSKTFVSVAATGVIDHNGNVGGNSATTAAGAAGAALSGANATTGASGAGAAGGAGTTAAGGSGATSAAVNGEGGAGGVGGNGGTGSGGVGGSGGNSGALSIRYFRNLQSFWKYTLVGTYMPTGTGGAGGAAGGGDGVNSGRGGGGGGSAGGGILIIADSLNNLGTIQTKGGAGGNGGAGALGNVGGGAGGGGGGGGKIMIEVNTLTSRGTLDVSGGAAGNGSAGAGTGSAGTAGAAGSAGYATTFEASTGIWTTTN